MCLECGWDSERARSAKLALQIRTEFGTTAKVMYDELASIAASIYTDRHVTPDNSCRIDELSDAYQDMRRHVSVAL